MDTLEKFGLAVQNNDHYEAEPYGGIYTMHKYWAKKPFNIIGAKIIENTKKGDIVLDPFCGSGVSVSEALFSGRRAIGVDINPSAILITREVISRVDLKKAKEELESIRREVDNLVQLAYSTKRDNITYSVTHFLWEIDHIKEVWYNSGSEKHRAVPSLEDENKANSFKYEMIQSFYPRERLYLNTRINVSKETYVYNLFTPRNLMILSSIYERIDKIEDESLKDFFLFCFNSSLGQASKMVFAIKNRGKFNGNSSNGKDRYEVGSWVIGYWRPKIFFEINPWNTFSRRVLRGIKAKADPIYDKLDVSESIDFESFLNAKEHNLLLCNNSAELAMKQLPPDSVDYVISDPPHGDREPYLELSTMWNSWLRVRADFENEIVISDSPERDKNISDYLERMKNVLKEIGRVLKDGGYFTLIFNNLDDEVWTDLLQSILSSHLKFIKLETMGYSATSVVQDTRKRGLTSDIMLTFQKSSTYTAPQRIMVLKNKDVLENVLSNLSMTKKRDDIELYSEINKTLIQLGMFMTPSLFFELLEGR